MGSRLLHKIFLFILIIMSVSNVLYAQDELCTDGILLFREDFGGNDPNDPMVSNAPMPGISSRYQQDYNYSAGRLAGMHYIIAKQGHPDSDFHAWHIMDDHTCPNDPTRGYFFETNSRANSYYTNYIYQKEVAGLCAGMELSFSAYFANVVTASEFKTVPFLSYSYPKFVFVVTDARSGEQLARYNTDTIGHDWSLYNIQDSWQYSAQWHLEGIKFTIPEGVDKVTLSIIDNPTQYGNAEGDDYAVDDIELYFCNNVEYQTVDTTICDTLLPFSWRDIEWIKADTIGKIYKDAQGNDSLYLVYSLRTIHCPYPSVSVSQDTIVCDTISQILWHDKLYPIANTLRDTLLNSSGFDSIYYELYVATEHCEEELCMDGTLLFREDFGGNDPSDPAVSMASVPGMSSQYYNSGNNLGSGYYTLRKEGWSNGIQWHRQDDHTYPDDKTRGYLLEVDGMGSAEPFYSKTIDGLCAGSKLTFSAYVVNVHYAGQLDYFGSSYVYPRMKFVLKDPTTGAVLAEKSTGDIQPDWRYGTPETWKYARDNALSAEWQLVGMNFIVPDGIESIRMFIYNDVERNGSGNDFALDDIEIRLCYMPAKKIVQDTIICDTIDNIVWRNKIYPLKNELRDTVYDSSGADSIYYILNVIMEHCCPEIKEKTITIGTLCDTLLPYTLYFRDTVLTFKMAGDLLLEFQHPQWDCIDSIYTFHLDTIHCERLYDIIVNKYNWQLLCHNVRVRELFPELTVTGYQWYKDGTAIPNATEDDYSEQNELQGEFQLRLHMSDGRYVWSEILTIQPGQTQAPSRIRIYNHNGYLFYQSEKETTIPSLPRGLYIIQIEQNGEQRIEKKLIP